MVRAAGTSTRVATVSFEANIIHAPGTPLFGLMSHVTPQLRQNVLHELPPPAWMDGPNLVADPCFVSGTDLHLTPESPALDFSNLFSYAVTDIDGLPRSVDLRSIPNVLGPVDLGAYELQVDSSIFFDGFETQ